MENHNLDLLPKNLPKPVDDGLANHLVGMKIPSVILKSTSGKLVDISSIEGWLVIYCYPLTAKPGFQLPEGWDNIPGARGCTPQSCAFRDHYQELKSIGANVIGVSTQTNEYQTEMAHRLHLPFEVLSDQKLLLGNALNLPQMNIQGYPLLKRLTMICHFSVIRHVHYPVFPPDEDPEKVLIWLKNNR